MLPVFKDRIYAIDVEVSPLPQYDEFHKEEESDESEEEDEELEIENPSFLPWTSKIIGIGVCWGSDYYTETAYFSEGQVAEVINFISQNKLKLAAHNVLYDWLHLQYHFGLPLNFIQDSGVHSQCINNSDFIHSFGLKQTTARLYCVETQEVEIVNYLAEKHNIKRKDYGKYIYLCPIDIISKYCRFDVHYCWRIIHDSHKWIPSDITMYMQLYMNEIRFTIWQIIHGIKIDSDGFRLQRDKLESEIAEIDYKFLNHPELKPHIEKVQKVKFNKKQSELKKKILDFEEWTLEEKNKFNINSTKQLKLLFDSQKLHWNPSAEKFEYPYVNNFPDTKIPNPDSPKLGTKFLHAYGIGGEILSDQSEKKVLLNHIKRALDDSKFDGRIHPNINMLGTKSGRISGSGVNIVATPIGDERYGKHLIADAGWRILSKDFCFLSGTEYLTQRGWVEILNLQESDLVWQVDPITLKGEFIKPIRVIKKDYSGNVYHYISGQNRGKFSVTENHRMFWIGQQSHQRKDKKEYRKWSLSQELVPTEGCNIGTFSYSFIESNFNEADIWKVCALQADGHLNQWGKWTIQVSEPRKVVKLKILFGEPNHQNLELRTGQNNNNYTWHLHFSHELLVNTKEKSFDLSKLGENQAEVFFEALSFWDGGYIDSLKYKTGRFQYFSTSESNIDKIQQFAVCNGYEAKKTLFFNGNEKHKKCFKLSIKRNGTIHFQPTNNCKIEKQHYEGKVGCVTVPTGLILIRNEGQTFLSGNCALEPSLLACLSNDPVLKYATYEGQGKEPFVKDGILWIDDIYLVAAYSASFMKNELENILDLSNWVKNSEVEKKNVKHIRSVAKTIVLATNYGASADKIQQTLSEQLKIKETIKNIQIFQDGYWASIAIAAQYKRKLEQEVRNKGYLVNIGGYPLVFYDRPGGRIDGAHKALNRMIQSSAAVCMKLFLYYFLPKIQKRDDVIPLVCDWHDANWMQVRIGSEKEINALAESALDDVNSTLNLPLKLRLDYHTGASFYDCK